MQGSNFEASSHALRKRGLTFQAMADIIIACLVSFHLNIDAHMSGGI